MLLTDAGGSSGSRSSCLFIHKINMDLLLRMNCAQHYGDYKDGKNTGCTLELPRNLLGKINTHCGFDLHSPGGDVEPPFQIPVGHLYVFSGCVNYLDLVTFPQCMYIKSSCRTL